MIKDIAQEIFEESVNGKIKWVNLGTCWQTNYKGFKLLLRKEFGYGVLKIQENYVDIALYRSFLIGKLVRLLDRKARARRKKRNQAALDRFCTIARPN